MTPRWESPLERPSPRDTALLAEVLGALERRLTEPPSDASPSAGGATPDGETPPDELNDLISAAVAELQRVAPVHRAEAGIAPVLGAGVLQELLRRRRSAQLDPVPPPVPSVDLRR